jgi:hypothetical protein
VIISIVVMDNVVKGIVNVMEVIPDHVVIFHVSFFYAKKKIISKFFSADLCLDVNCNQGTCLEGYTGGYCEILSRKMTSV